MRRLLEHYQTVLAGLAANPDQRLADVPLLPDVERHQLLVAWNDTWRDDPPARGLHTLFEAQVKRAPEAVAVVCGEDAVTYHELNARANRLAHYLRRYGVGPEVRVGLYLERSLDLVIALLGILKAGGVVVAVNPTYPPDEVLTPVNDANIEIMFTLTRFYRVLRAVRERSKLKRIIVSNIKETLPPVLRILFTLAKEKKEGHHLDTLDSGDIWMKDLLKKHENSPKPNVKVMPEDYKRVLLERKKKDRIAEPAVV